MSLRYILFTALLLTVSLSYARKEFPIRTVVIDAGHGGKDPGASGPGHINEKNISLIVALKLGELIQKTFPEIKIIYTRKTDEFIELHERAEIANRNKADLFISVHCNASTNSEAYGTSTYVLGLHRTEANLDVAKRENSVILMEEDRAKNYEFDPNSAEGHIIMSMKQNAFLDQSIDMASKIENQYEDNSRRKSLGVKQAGFYVLYKTTMPSLLSEIGFISNPEEEKFLNSSKGQDQIAESLFNAFKQYKAGVEIASAREEGGDKQIESKPETTKPTTQAAPATSAPAESEFTTLANGKKVKLPTENTGGGGKVIAPKAETPAPPKVEPVTVTVTKTDTVFVTKTIEAPAVVKAPETTAVEPKAPANPAPPIKKDTVVKVEVVTTETKKTITEQPLAREIIKEEPVKKVEPVKEPVKKEEPVKVEAKPVKVEPKVEAPKAEVKTEVKTETKAEVKVEPKAEPKPATTTTSAAPARKPAAVMNFKIQLYALTRALNSAEREKIVRLFKSISEESLPSGVIRYYGGNTGSFTDAKKLLAIAGSNGYAGAFIIGTREGKRLGADEMKALDEQ